MIKKLQNFLESKTHLVFDFDRTLAKMEIDWSGWHKGIAEVYALFDPHHGYAYGKNPHMFHNKLIAVHGEPLIEQARKFNQEYEAQHLIGFTPNTELVNFVQNNVTHSLYVYSSNSRHTVVRGLSELGITDKFNKNHFQR